MQVLFLLMYLLQSTNDTTAEHAALVLVLKFSIECCWTEVNKKYSPFDGAEFDSLLFFACLSCFLFLSLPFCLLLLLRFQQTCSKMEFLYVWIVSC